MLTDWNDKTSMVTNKRLLWGCVMQKASISELKASASEYLMRVKAGEEVLLTDRGKPIAKIIPIRKAELTADYRISQLELAGLARVGKSKIPADFWLTPRLRDEEGSVLTGFIAEREEGR